MGAAIPDGGANLLFGIILAENCMKMKKKWTRGGARPSYMYLPRSTNDPGVHFHDKKFLTTQKFFRKK